MKHDEILDKMKIALDCSRVKSDKLFEREEELKNLLNEKVNIETPIKSSIFFAKDNFGKDVYSNESKRDVELKERLKNNEGYQEIIKQINKVMVDIDNLKRQIKYTEMEFSMYKALCYLQVM